MLNSVKFGSNKCVYVLKWEKIKSRQQSKLFLKENETLIEDTLNELLKAETESAVSSAKSNLDYTDSTLIEFQSVSRREMQVINLVVQGNRNKQIARHLQISIETVNKHLNNVFKKLGVKSRFELITKVNNNKN